MSEPLKIEDAVFHRRLQKGAHEAEPLHLAVAKLLRLIRVRVADENDRLGRCVGHSCPHNLHGNLPAHAGKSSGPAKRRDEVADPPCRLCAETERNFQTTPGRE